VAAEEVYRAEIGACPAEERGVAEVDEGWAR